MFLVLEGIDGAGKGRQRQELTEYLRPGIKELRSVEFPDHQGALYREIIKPALLEKISLPKNAWFLAFALDQILYSEQIMKAKGSSRAFFICDGYFTTNLVYNALVNNLISLDKALEFARDFDIPAADLNIFIDVDPKIALNRKKSEEGHEEGLDINERDLEKQHRIRAAYLKLSSENIFGPWEVVDGNGTVSEVTENILKVLKEHNLVKGKK